MERLPISPLFAGRPMRIAIVGAGVSGLLAAHILQRSHEVTLFEASAGPGGHVDTHEIRLGATHHIVDTGFMVFNEVTYPNFSELLKRLGIASQKTDMALSVRSERSGVEWGSGSLGSVFSQPGNLLRPSFRRMIRDIVRFQREAPTLLSPDEKRTLGEYLVGERYSQVFIDTYAIPVSASIWSARPDRILAFPVRPLVQFLSSHGFLPLSRGLEWRFIPGGARRYVDALLARFRGEVRLASPVHAICRRATHVDVELGGSSLRFDRVVLAVHSDQAVGLLVDASPAESQILGAIEYQENEAVLHTDERLLPRYRRSRKSWNYLIPERPLPRPIVTYDLRRLQSVPAADPLLVTLNPQGRVRPERMLWRMTYHHPVFTREAIAAQQLHHEIDGKRRTHFCGAYWGDGFHEDGVRSALAVCEKFGEGL